MLSNIKYKTFTYHDQLFFSKLSGDWNPLHLDEQASRRSIFGVRIVHGIHIVLWALDNISSNNKELYFIKNLKVNFNNYVELDEEISIIKKIVSKSHIEIRVKSKKNIKALIILKFGEKIDLNKPKERIFNKKEAIFNNKIKKNNKKKYLYLCISTKLLKEKYKNVLKNFCPFQLSLILTTSRIVGMYCPGKYSIFSALSLNFNYSNSNRLYYKTMVVSEKFSFMKMHLTSGDITGEIDAFFPPSPNQNNNFTEIKRRVKQDAFKDFKVLVIGASRGLGAISSQIFAAGGAKLFLSYYKGKNDCIKLAKVLRSNYLEIDINSYDFRKLNFTPTHILYFATPKVIEESKRNNAKLINIYDAYYSKAFKKMVKYINKKTFIFYPSTQFIQNPPLKFIQYVKSKVKGEKICNDININNKDIYIYISRLPILNTDLNMTLTKVQLNDAFEVLLDEFKNWLGIDFIKK